MRKKQYRPLRCYVPDEDLDNLHRQLAEREVKTPQVSKWLEDRAGDRVFPCVQVALPVPVGNPEVLMLWLRIFKHLRSPTWDRPNRRFVADADKDIVRRCRAALEEMHEVCRLSASTRGEWSAYIASAIDLLKPREAPRWASRAFKANAARWDKY